MFAETESENFTTQRKLDVWPTYNSMVPKNIFDQKITLQMNEILLFYLIILPIVWSSKLISLS